MHQPGKIYRRKENLLSFTALSASITIVRSHHMTSMLCSHCGLLLGNKGEKSLIYTNGVNSWGILSDEFNSNVCILRGPSDIFEMA